MNLILHVSTPLLFQLTLQYSYTSRPIIQPRTSCTGMRSLTPALFPSRWLQIQSSSSAGADQLITSFRGWRSLVPSQLPTEIPSFHRPDPLHFGSMAEGSSSVAPPPRSGCGLSLVCLPNEPLSQLPLGPLGQSRLPRWPKVDTLSCLGADTQSLLGSLAD